MVKDRNNTVRVMITGDVNLGDHPVCIGHGVKSKQIRFGVEFPFLKIKELLKKADLRIGNCEVVLSERGMQENLLSSMEFRSYPDAVRGLKYAQFDIMSVPTNHALNHGEEAFWESIEIMEREGIRCVGIKNQEDGCIPVVVNLKEISIGILAYSFRPEKYFQGIPCYAQGDDDIICRDIMKLKSRCNIVVISLHWGDEFIQRPSLWQIESARRFIDSGASIVFGHHPHVLQGIEKYKNGYIAYSLGNFVCDMWQVERRETVIIDVVVGKDGVKSFDIIPVMINKSFQPEELTGEEGKRLKEKMNRLSNLIYDEDFSNRDEKDKIYNKEVTATVKKNRYESYIYFLSRFYRYRPAFFYQNIKRALMRRL